MPHNITDTSTFTAPVAAPADGDNDAQATFDPAFQALANRTRFLADAMGGATSYPQARVVSVFPVHARSPDTVPAFGACDSHVWPKSTGASERLTVDLTPHLRTGCTLTGIEVIVKPAGASAVTAKLYKHDGGGASAPTVTQLGSTASSSGTAAQPLDVTCSQAVARNAQAFTIDIEAGQSGDIVYWISLSFSDPGPRNY